MTVEGPGDMFQIVRDALDTARLLDSEMFMPATDAKANSVTTSTQF
jgi:hypothetical protein